MNRILILISIHLTVACGVELNNSIKSSAVSMSDIVAGQMTGLNTCLENEKHLKKKLSFVEFLAERQAKQIKQFKENDIYCEGNYCLGN